MSALDRIYEAAAEARSTGVRAPADRPSQRRAGELPGGLPVARSTASITVTRGASSGDGGSLSFAGFASVYNRGYEMWDLFGPYTEQVSSGAGASSLARADLDVPLVLNHDSLRRIARTTNGSLLLREDTVGEDEGLYVEAPNLDLRDQDVAYIAPKLESGLVDEMSFRFSINRGSWSPDWSEFHIEEYDLQRGDVAIVGYGANPYTAGSGLRSSGLPGQERALEEFSERELVALENSLHAERQRRGGMSLADLDRISRAVLLAPSLA